MKIKSKILIIAGSDSSGGAGIQADIKSVTSLGSYAMTAITAVTAQNTTGVKSIIPMPSIEISNQIEFTSKDIKPDSVKDRNAAFYSSYKFSIKINKKIKIKKNNIRSCYGSQRWSQLIDNKAILVLKKKLIKKLI